MTETDKSEGESVMPPTVPIKGVNQPDPTSSGAPETKDVPEAATGHEAFEKAKAETQGRD